MNKIKDLKLEINENNKIELIVTSVNKYGENEDKIYKSYAKIKEVCEEHQDDNRFALIWREYDELIIQMDACKSNPYMITPRDIQQLKKYSKNICQLNPSKIKADWHKDSSESTMYDYVILRKGNEEEIVKELQKICSSHNITFRVVDRNYWAGIIIYVVDPVAQLIEKYNPDMIDIKFEPVALDTSNDYHNLVIKEAEKGKELIRSYFRNGRWESRVFSDDAFRHTLCKDILMEVDELQHFLYNLFPNGRICLSLLQFDAVNKINDKEVVCWFETDSFFIKARLIDCYGDYQMYVYPVYKAIQTN